MAKQRFGRTIVKTLAAGTLAVLAYGGIQYGRVMGDMNDGAALYSQGDTEGALHAYERAEQRLRAHGAMRLIPSRDRQTLLLNQGRLLYVLNRFDDATERLAREDEISGIATDPRFYLLRGNLGFRRTMQNYQRSTALDLNALSEGLLVAEDAYRESLQREPTDWDAKFNYEFVDNIRKSIGGAAKEGEKMLKDVEQAPTPELPPELAG